MMLVEALDHQSKSLALILLKQTQNIFWIYIIILIIVVYLLMENKYLNLSLTIKMLTNPVFVLEVYLMDLALLSLKSIFNWKWVWFFTYKK